MIADDFAKVNAAPEIQDHRFKALSLKHASGFGWSVDPAKEVANLRALADQIERGEVCITAAEQGTRAGADDFTVESLTVEYAKKLGGS